MASQSGPEAFDGEATAWLGVPRAAAVTRTIRTVRIQLP
jgi:hypothetical protein